MSSEKKFDIKRGIIPFFGAVIVFVLSFCVLYLGDNVGLSDNGDFRRVLLTNNIEYKDNDNRYYLFNQNYKMKLDKSDFGSALYSAWQTNDEEEIYKSPHFLIIKLSKIMNVTANAVCGRTLDDYNIAYMAVIYIFMLALAAWMIFAFFSESSPKIRITVFFVFIFMFCDAGYLLYFNSFYGEPLQYTSLMLLIAFGLLIYRRPSVPKVIGFYTALYFFAGSKLANIAFSMIAALLAIQMVIMRKDKIFRIGVIASAVICMGAMCTLYAEIPDWMDNDTTYQAVFFGILKNSDDPESDLRELGVNEKYAVLAGTHAYMDDDSEYPIDIKTYDFEKNFYDKVSKADIALFYVRHPLRLMSEAACAIENSAYIRPPVTGNSLTVPMEFTDKYSGWSKLRVLLGFLYEPWFIAAVFVLITAYMIFMNVLYIHNRKKETPARRYMIYALDILVFGLWVNMLLPIVCNGEADIAKHMFLFTNCVDILVALGIAALVGMPLKNCLRIVAAAAVFTVLFHISLPKRTITFGELYGEPIKWEIIEEYDDGTMLIATKNCVGYMPFDDESNSWEESDLRQWLNGEFLSGFSAEERGRVVMSKNKCFLSYSERDNAEGGNHAHYWNFTPELVYDMGETAYYNYVEDEVFIPTLSVTEKTRGSEACWIMCPYTSNSYMERYINSDGFILHTDVKNEKGVRAVIRIKEE